MPAATRCCTICLGEPALHFNLIVSVRRVGHQKTTRGAGSIDLCQRCWREATKQAGRRRPAS